MQRFSRRLLDEAHRLARVESFVAWSEMAAPTLCLVAGLHMSFFLPEHAGEPFAFNGRVSRERWAELEDQDRAAGRGRLYHTLKW